MGFLSSIGKAVTKTLDVVATTFTHPIQVAKAIVSPTKTVQQVVDEHFSQSVTKQNVETLITTAGYVTALGGAASVATKGIVGAAKALIPSTIKGKVALATVAPIAAGVAIANPEVAIKTLTIPQNLGNIGVNAGTFLLNPTTENFLTIYKENPVTAGLLTAIPAFIGFKSLLPAVNQIKQTNAIQEQTKAIEDTNKIMTKDYKQDQKEINNNTGQPIINIINELPKQETISTPLTPAVVAPPEAAPAGDLVPKTKKKTTKKKTKAKKKTRRSKKKTTKKKTKAKKKTRRSKKKTIKRKKTR